MSTQSKARRERASNVCSFKCSYSSLAEAGKVARSIRFYSKTRDEGRVVPYLCPNGRDHYHVGRNSQKVERIRDIVYRLRLGLKIVSEELEFAGLEEGEIKLWRDEEEEDITYMRRIVGLRSPS